EEDEIVGADRVDMDMDPSTGVGPISVETSRSYCHNKKLCIRGGSEVGHDLGMVTMDFREYEDDVGLESGRGILSGGPVDLKPILD
ncbi:hypothetical protein Dimus_022242, partial [Dionaea muscipula]